MFEKYYRTGYSSDQYEKCEVKVRISTPFGYINLNFDSISNAEKCLRKLSSGLSIVGDGLKISKEWEDNIEPDHEPDEDGDYFPIDSHPDHEPDEDGDYFPIDSHPDHEPPAYSDPSPDKEDTLLKLRDDKK
jgi:hypothetical protein